jgi:hypothetical protein|tara:strand:- start:34 stop:183 length:150 start_codon:yes stop_codon:yes gene_type:complete
MSKEKYTYAPYRLLEDYSFTVPDTVFIGYDVNGKAKFKKQNKDERDNIH